MSDLTERRTQTLTEADIDLIRGAFYGDMTQDEHMHQHNIFKDFLNREQIKAAKRERYKSQFIGGLLVALAGGIPACLYWIGTWVKDHWK